MTTPRSLRHRRLRAALRAGVLALPAALGLACATGGLNPLDALGLGRVDVDDEREIGRRFDRDLQQGGRLVRDPVVTEFVEDLGLALVEEAEPQPFVYRFRVVSDPSLNAFAVPGGYVYLHSGTILRAGSLDELAGVVAHEIGHVDGHHFARLHARTALPDLLANLAAVGAAVAVGEPALATAGQGLNQALHLRWSRDLEREADERSAALMARRGWDPAGVATFFERIRDEADDPAGGRVPPYLYSHPDVAERIEAARARAEHWHRLDERTASGDPGPPDARRVELEAAFRRAQRRLARIEAGAGGALDAGDATRPQGDPRRSEALLARAAREEEAGDTRRALATLGEAARCCPDDPRVAFHIGEILEREGDVDGALAAYQRTLELDPSRGLVHFRVGLLRRDRGERQRAVHAFEEAWARFAPDSALRARADYEIAKLEYGVFEETSLDAGSGTADPTATRIDPRAERLVWRGRVRSRFGASADRIRVRWTDPSGAVRREGAPERSGNRLVSRLARAADAPFAAGAWTVEAILDGAVVDRARAWVAPASAQPTSPSAPGRARR